VGQDAPFSRSPAKRKRAARTACFLASVWHMRWSMHGVRSAGTGGKAFGDSGLGEFAQAVIETVQLVRRGFTQFKLSGKMPKKEEAPAAGSGEPADQFARMPKLDALYQGTASAGDSALSEGFSPCPLPRG